MAAVVAADGPADPAPTSFIEVVGDRLTLLGFFLAPLLQLRLGATPVSEMVLFLALAIRGLQAVSTGLPMRELSRHSVLLAVSAAICVGGFLSGIVNGQSLTFDLLKVGLTTFGSIFLVAYAGRTEADRRRLVVALSLGFVALALSGFLMAPVVNRAVGLTTHPNFLGHSCIMGVAAALFCRDNTPRRWVSWAWTAAVLLELAAIVQSGSRGSLLGVWVVGMLYVIVGRRTQMIAALGVLSYLLVVALLMGVISLPKESAVGRLIGGSTATGADQAREQGLSDNFRIITRDPVFGEGFTLPARPDDVYFNVHNGYLQNWIAAGVVGAIAVMLLGILLLVLPFAQPRATLPLACGAAGIALAWAITNIFFTRDQWIYLVLTLRMTVSPLKRLNARRLGVEA